MYRNLVFAVILISLIITGCNKPKGDSEVFATVNGTPITKGEVDKEIESNLKRIQTEIYKMEKMGVDQLIDQKILEDAAKKEGKSADKYMEDYVAANVKDPTEDEIKSYYEFRKKQMGDKKYEEVKGMIADFIKSNQKNAASRKLMMDLRSKADIKINIEPPRVDIKIGDSPTMGPKDAPITIVEFTDYQCPYCGRVRPTINALMEEYPDKILYVLKDNPLSFHKDAPKAHESAHCAGDQGKYWEMNKELFANQQKLARENLDSYAKNIGLDMDKFKNCLDSGKYTDMVNKSTLEGQMAGVSGTPAFFINGILLSGARPYADFKETIEAELK